MSLRAMNPKPMKRGPFGLDGLVLADLGRALEWEMSSGVVVRASRGMRLLWSPEKKALVMLEGAKWGSPSTSAWEHVESQSDGRAAKRKFEAWADRKAKKARAVSFKLGKATWSTTHATVSRIDYWSDKWGNKSAYTHDFGRGVRLYILSASSRGPAVWVMKGGRMTVTERGIVG